MRKKLAITLLLLMLGMACCGKRQPEAMTGRVIGWGTHADRKYPGVLYLEDSDRKTQFLTDLTLRQYTDYQYCACLIATRVYGDSKRAWSLTCIRWYGEGE